MGMTVSGNVTFGKPLIASLASLPAVTIAFSEAVIDKAYLTWLDVSKLLAAFPKNVQVLDDIVTLQGPVMIVSSMSPIRRLFIQSMLAIAAGVVQYIAFRKIFHEPVIFFQASHASTGGSRSSSTHMSITILPFLPFVVAAVSFYLAGRYLPNQAGVYFYNQPPFYA